MNANHCFNAETDFLPIGLGAQKFHCYAHIYASICTYVTAMHTDSWTNSTRFDFHVEFEFSPCLGPFGAACRRCGSLFPFLH